MTYAQHLKDRYRLMIGYVGTIFFALAFLLLIPLLAAIGFGEFHVIDDLFLSALIAAAVGLFLRHNIRDNAEVSLTIQEGGVIVMFAWFGSIFISALPFQLSGQLTFTQAIFEASSGWSTTGLSVMDVTATPKALLLWRSMTQFLGGAGLTVLMLSAIIGPLGLGLFNAEGRSDKLLPNVAQSAKAIMFIHIGYAFSGFVLYLFAGLHWFDALIHSMSALSTGGFSTQVTSIGAFNSLPVELITIILMILGSTNYAAHYLYLNRQGKKFLKVDEVRLTWALLIIFIPFITFFFTSRIYGSLGFGLRVGAFQVISSLSGTGYTTINLADWDGFPRLILIIMMVLGGMTGSTAGGLKMYRVVLLLKSLVWNVRGYLLPKNIIRENVVHRPDGPVFIKKSMIIEAANFVTMYIFFYLGGVIVFLLYDYSLSDSLFEIASALSTVGLSVGITAPTAPLGILWTMIVMMVMGRLEFFVIFFASIKVIKDMSYLARRQIA